MEVHTVDGWPAEDVVAAWASLWERDPDATLFHHPRFLGTWYRHLGGRVQPRIYLISDGEELRGVVPTELERVGSPVGPRLVLRSLGGTEVTDYQGPLAAPADREAVAHAWARAVTEDRDWDELDLGGLPEDTGWVALLAAALGARGLEPTVSAHDTCPRIDLADGAAGWLQRLGSRRRHELRRKQRKLHRELGEPEVQRWEPGRIDEFLDLASAAGGDKGRFFLDERMRAFFSDLAAEFGPDGALLLHALVVDHQTLAATVTLRWRREWGLYNSAFDGTLRALAPGVVLVGALIRVAAEEGAAVFDLLRGAEPYKFQLGATPRRLCRIEGVRR